MLLHVLGLRHDFEIVWRVVPGIAVYVVDNLAGAQRAPNLHLRDDPMLMPAVALDVATPVATPTLRVSYDSRHCCAAAFP